MSRAKAHAKLNLALVVGPRCADGKHEVATVLQAIDLHDDVELMPADELAVDGFAEDTLVRAALQALAAAAGVEPRWRVRIEKRIPVAAGLGGGSSNAATALRLANALLPDRLSDSALHELAAGLGSDVPFFLRAGAQLGTDDGSELQRLELPTDYVVLLVLPRGVTKPSTASVYDRFDERAGDTGFEERRAGLLEALDGVEEARDLARLPPNDLVTSGLADDLRELGAFRADVTGAGPAVYGRFDDTTAAGGAACELAGAGETSLARPLA